MGQRDSLGRGVPSLPLILHGFKCTGGESLLKGTWRGSIMLTPP